MSTATLPKPRPPYVASDRAPTRPRLQDNLFWLLLGNIAFSGCQYALIVVIARLGDVSMVGQYALAVAITAPPVLFANCALRTVQAADARDTFSFADYATFRMLSLVLAAVTIGIVSIFASEQRGLIYAVAVTKIWESIGDLIHGLMQKHERMELIGYSQILKGCGSLVAACISIYLTGNIDVACWAMAGVFAAVVLLFDLPYALSLRSIAKPRRMEKSSWTKRLSELAWLTLPMGLTVVSGSLLTNVPRYFLGAYRGDDELGMFAALAWLALCGNLFASAMAHAALPRLSQHYANDDVEEFRDMCCKMICGGAVGAVAMVTWGIALAPLLLWLCYGPQYAEHAGAFRVLIVGMALSIELCFLDNLLYAARWFRVQVPLNAVALVVMVVACWWLVPAYGLMAAALIVCIITAMQVVARLLVARHILRIMTRNSSSRIAA